MMTTTGKPANEHGGAWHAKAGRPAAALAAVLLMGAQTGGAADTPLTAGIVVREISIRRASDNAPVSTVSPGQNYRVRVLIKNTSSGNARLHYIETKTSVVPATPGSRFFSDSNYSQEIPAYTSGALVLAPDQQREFNIPARFSAGNSRDKQFVVSVTGAEIPIKTGSKPVNSM